MKIEIPGNVNTVLSTIREAGFEAYIVGGCVRDAILGRTAQDWDITTSAKPQQVKALFRRTVDTGIRHGTVTVLIGDDHYEVTTYRIDGDYKDGRHPEHVCFTDRLSEDLRRRDFTINAMAYSEETGLIDLYDGLGDIRRRKIRAVGDAAERFGEDALRVMRALRFCAQLDYTMDEGTQEAVRELAGTLRRISAERIRTELDKLLLSPHPEKLTLAYELGVTKVFLPELDACMTCPQNNHRHQYNVGEHTVRAVCASLADPVVRLALLLHDIAKPQCRTTDSDGQDHFKDHAELGAVMAEAILERLKYDNRTKKSVVRLVRFHSMEPEAEETAVRKAVAMIGTDLYGKWLALRQADAAALAPSEAARVEKLVFSWKSLYAEILKRGDCLSLSGLAVSGSDLMEAGIPRGTQIGRVLAGLLEDVLENPEHNTRPYLLDRCGAIAAKALKTGDIP